MLKKEWNALPWYDASGETGEPAVALVVLDPGGLDFLIDALPRDDAFTQELVELRAQAMKHLWRITAN